MIYHVKAKLRDDTAREFLSKLTDGTVAAQRPDGSEIIASMERAVVNPAGQVEWSELCYCSPPLAHERETVLDLHFTDISTEPAEAHTRYEGRPFMEHLRALSERSHSLKLP
ncbi:MAG: hypothetical protein HKN05_03640 [Rhizobiales bacterium]|nr:hypothetical protein [Hyphomicrobiales bacterium]